MALKKLLSKMKQNYLNVKPEFESIWQKVCHIFIAKLIMCFVGEKNKGFSLGGQ